MWLKMHAPSKTKVFVYGTLNKSNTVGLEEKVSFWMNDWLEAGLSSLQFPFIYVIAQNKNILIKDSFMGSTDRNEHSVNWVDSVKKISKPKEPTEICYPN